VTRCLIVIACLACAPAGAVEPAGTVTLLRSAPVELRLEQAVSSSTARVGERIVFSVAEDVWASKRVVIRRGSAAWGRITAVSPPSRLARDGRIQIELEGVCLADGSRGSLRGAPENSADASSARRSGGGDSIFLVPAFPVLLFMQGRDVHLEQGTEITAWTEGPATLSVGRLASAPVTECNSPSDTSVVARSTPSDARSTVVVRSNPAGADILVDGKFAGQTPSTLRLEPGDRHISLRLPGRATWQRTLSVTPAGQSNLSAVLEEQTVATDDKPWLWSVPPPPATSSTPDKGLPR